MEDKAAGDEKKNASYEYNEKIHQMYCGHLDENRINGTLIEKVMMQCTSIIL